MINLNTTDPLLPFWMVNTACTAQAGDSRIVTRSSHRTKWLTRRVFFVHRQRERSPRLSLTGTLRAEQLRYYQSNCKSRWVETHPYHQSVCPGESPWIQDHLSYCPSGWRQDRWSGSIHAGTCIYIYAYAACITIQWWWPLFLWVLYYVWHAWGRIKRLFDSFLVSLQIHFSFSSPFNCYLVEKNLMTIIARFYLKELTWIQIHVVNEHGGVIGILPEDAYRVDLTHWGLNPQTPSPLGYPPAQQGHRFVF